MATETARQLASTGAISPALLGIVESAATSPGAAGLMLGAGYYALFDFITRAQQIAADEAQKQALANEIATLALEVARKERLSEAAAIQLAQITAMANSNSRPTDWADPTTNPFDDTFGIPD